MAKKVFCDVCEMEMDPYSGNPFHDCDLTVEVEDGVNYHNGTTDYSPVDICRPCWKIVSFKLELSTFKIPKSLSELKDLLKDKKEALKNKNIL